MVNRAVAEPVDLGAVPVVDHNTLATLAELGDLAFVVELISTFDASSQAMLAELDDAVGRLDADAFQDTLHALRSSAANIGARRVYALALEWRAASREQLATEGDAMLHRLSDVLAMTETGLRAWIDTAQGQGQRVA